MAREMNEPWPPGTDQDSALGLGTSESQKIPKCLKKMVTFYWNNIWGGSKDKGRHVSGWSTNSICHNYYDKKKSHSKYDENYFGGGGRLIPNERNVFSDCIIDEPKMSILISFSTNL